MARGRAREARPQKKAGGRPRRRARSPRRLLHDLEDRRAEAEEGLSRRPGRGRLLADPAQVETGALSTATVGRGRGRSRPRGRARRRRWGVRGPRGGGARSRRSAARRARSPRPRAGTSRRATACLLAGQPDPHLAEHAVVAVDGEPAPRPDPRRVGDRQLVEGYGHRPTVAAPASPMPLEAVLCLPRSPSSTPESRDDATARHTDAGLHRPARRRAADPRRRQRRCPRRRPGGRAGLDGLPLHRRPRALPGRRARDRRAAAARRGAGEPHCRPQPRPTSTPTRAMPRPRSCRRRARRRPPGAARRCRARCRRARRSRSRLPSTARR